MYLIGQEEALNYIITIMISLTLMILHNFQSQMLINVSIIALQKMIMYSFTILNQIIISIVEQLDLKINQHLKAKMEMPLVLLYLKQMLTTIVMQHLICLGLQYPSIQDITIVDILPLNIMHLINRFGQLPMEIIIFGIRYIVRYLI